MSDIQKARDVLASWVEGNVNPWCFDREGVITDDLGYVRAKAGADAQLIVGTAGNPELLAAIDGLLRSAPIDAENYSISRIAAAIIAANERMRRG